jgi:hypothetical protein
MGITSKAAWQNPNACMTVEERPFEGRVIFHESVWALAPVLPVSSVVKNLFLLSRIYFKTHPTPRSSNSPIIVPVGITGGQEKSWQK